MKKLNILLAAAFASATMGLSSCSDSYMTELNTNETKSSHVDPNTQLTTSLLQIYGDFGMMDTYRSYITGFTQHFAGGWNVSNYAGSVHYNDDQARLVWDKLYSVSIKNLNDAILNSEKAGNTNINAVLRIQKVYVMSILTDMYGDVPCSEAGWSGLKEGATSTPKYDEQKDIYNYFFEELKACVDSLSDTKDAISGDVTSLGGDVNLWKKFANSLRMRYAMRISDVSPEKAKSEFMAAYNSAAGYIKNSSEDAYVKHQDSPFTLYDGANDNDFRANSLSAILYGQDPTSPTFVCATFFDIMNANSDPRLYAICRHYINTKRSEIKPDVENNVDVTDEVRLYLGNDANMEQPCKVGAAWWNNWLQPPSNASIPTLARLVASDPSAGYDQSNFPARMMRPFLSINFEKPNAPGIFITSAEVNFLLAEAASKGWGVIGDVQSLFEAGVRASIALLNEQYLPAKNRIAEELISDFITGLNETYDLTDAEQAREAINTQAWILHMTNPNEAWANLRRSDYPVLVDRTKLPKFLSDFTYDDDIKTPVRLRYPKLEEKYNAKSLQEAKDRMGGSDNWHTHVWWDKNDINVK